MSKLAPFAKAIAPAALTLVSVLVELVITKSFDELELSTAITGFLTSVVVYFVPNAARTNTTPSA